MKYSDEFVDEVTKILESKGYVDVEYQYEWTIIDSADVEVEGAEQVLECKIQRHTWLLKCQCHNGRQWHRETGEYRETNDPGYKPDHEAQRVELRVRRACMKRTKENI